MRNGYALCTRAGLDAITEHLSTLKPAQLDILRGKLCIGIHHNVEVTDADGENHPFVSQAFCSALPVAYSPLSAHCWQAFASLVLEAAYEATMMSAVLKAQSGASNVVFLTRLGGSAFGNGDSWINDAMSRALSMMSSVGLDVRIVSHSKPSTAITELANRFRLY